MRYGKEAGVRTGGREVDAGICSGERTQRRQRRGAERQGTWTRASTLAASGFSDRRLNKKSITLNILALTYFIE